MRGWPHSSYELCRVIAGSIVVLVILGTWLSGLAQGWRAKKPHEIEKLRRLHVNRHGRISSAEIVDVVEEGPLGNPNRVLVYRYQVAGVIYEASQEISSFLGLSMVTDALSGQQSCIKYDPRKPANSIIACEEWSGLKPKNPATAAINSTESA